MKSLEGTVEFILQTYSGREKWRNPRVRGKSGVERSSESVLFSFPIFGPYLLYSLLAVQKKGGGHWAECVVAGVRRAKYSLLDDIYLIGRVVC